MAKINARKVEWSINVVGKDNYTTIEIKLKEIQNFVEMKKNLNHTSWIQLLNIHITYIYFYTYMFKGQIRKWKLY